MDWTPDFEQPSLTRLLNWIGFEVQLIGTDPNTSTDDVNTCAQIQRDLTPLLNASIAAGLKAAFDRLQQAKTDLTNLIKKMQATSDQLRHQEDAVSTFLGIVISLVKIFSAATGGTGAAGTIITQISAAADNWLP